ncbi:MAG: acyltransferase [Thermodesulfobacteriota bacterium]|nr:acyltransferase [Thermodesulfobacteriota bacterium]
MLSFLPGPVRGVMSLFLYVANTIFWCIPLYTVSILKFLVPITAFRDICSKILVSLAFAWVNCNNMNQRLLNPMDIRVNGLEKLNRKDWYLFIANHQSWVDILILQRVFYKKAPFLKFFLKKELIWVPILGLAWWALDFPFMRRYSANFLKKHPHLKGKDIEITRKACQKFSRSPVSVINFLEGTRNTPEKHDKQKSPYTHLLKPKAGGIAFVLAAMGEHLNSIVNVTIIYPPGPKSFWDFVCGRIDRVFVNVEILPIAEVLIGDYFEDEEFRNRFQVWVNDLWEKNDLRITQMKYEN